MQGKRWAVFKTVLSAIAVIVSIVISIIMINLGEYPRRQAFSSIGNANRGLFAVWGLFTGLAVYLNMRLLARRLNFKSITFEIFLAIGCLMILVTTTVVGRSQAWDWQRIVHLISAQLFGLIGLCLVITLMIVKLKRKGKKTSVTYLTAILLSTVFLIVSTIYLGWFTAYTQMLVINTSLVAMFCSNYIEKWSMEYNL